MTVDLVSFISLVTTDAGLFKKTAQFYHALGFRLVKNYNKVSTSAASSIVNGI